MTAADCTDRMTKDGVTYTCAGDHGPDEMHRSPEGAFWSPGMGIPISTLETPTERAMSPEARLVADTLAGVNRTLHGTDEEVHAARVAEQKVFTDRHEHLLAVITDPILRDLVSAHGPACAHGPICHSDIYSICAECPPVPDSCCGDEDPASWPCPVWMFVSDRM